MASHSRIDQFFGSKKRKAVSPSLKTGRNEDAKVSNEVSPSAKGSLVGYLVTTSQDGGGVAKRGLSPGKDNVRRNLALEIDKDAECKSRPVVAVREHAQSQILENLKNVREDVTAASRYAVDVGSRHLSKDCPASDVGSGSSELKRFAKDFLSLYCSELQSSTDIPPDKQIHNKRPGSQIEDANENASKKRHCVTSMSEIEAKRTCFGEENIGDKQSYLTKEVLNTNSSGEVAVGKDSTDLQASLRKCNKGHMSTANMTELQTPGSLNSKVLARGTPNSAHGSSMFSPGEAFWSEAIQLADGLCCPVDRSSNCYNQLYETSICAENHIVTTSVNMRNGKCTEKSEKTLIMGESGPQLMRINSSLESLGKHTKDSSKKVSQLPVKHFDFSQDVINFDVTTTNLHAKDTPKDNKVRISGDFECGSVTKSQRTMCAVTRCDGAKISEDLEEDRKLTFLRAPSKGNMVANHDGDKYTSNLVVGDFGNCVGTPSSYVAHRNCLELRSWLPPELCQIYTKKGISKLYPWQVECLQVDGVLQKRNLVYCASTSAGKSFVAEILMLRRVISTGKMALLVLPYVSICTEKAEHLEVLLEPLGKHVRSYFGNQGGGTLPKDTSVAVCTIEKANSLINRLLEEGRLSELGIIVIDELHMVGDQNRGYLLELMLTKLRYAAGEGNSDSTSGESSGSSSGKADPAYGLQIVGMSATMPNVAAVADWLCAALYETDFRPVPLEEYIKVGNTIYNKEMDIVRTIPKASNLGGKDPDHIVELCNEVVQEGHSVLIFCSSRKGCESTARHVSKFLKRFSVKAGNDTGGISDIGSAIDSLRKCPAGLDPTLEETLPTGVAYHHAGLTVEEREVVETCYRRGLIRVLTATSTLAAGVNLPARRVIFRQPKIGYDYIDGTRYKQMSGRAGRTGIDTKGESVLICKPEEVKRIIGLLNKSCPPLHSCLSEDKNGMTHAILEVVAGSIVQTAKDIHRYVKCTLLNSTKPFEDVVKSAQDSLRWLCHRKFLEWNEDTKLYSTTPLGRAAFGSSLCPEESLIVLDDLLRAREGFVLASDLHLVYLVTPTNVEVEPDWEIYYERFMQLSPLDQSVGNRVGVAEPFLMRMAHGAPLRTSNRSRENTKRLHVKVETRLCSAGNSMPSDEHTLRVSKRFYVALILSKLVQEAPVTEVCEAFKVARGMVQSLQEHAGRFASMVSVFCERLGWHDLEGLVAKFQNRVSFGVRAEIVELTTIPYVKGPRARALYKAGLRTPLAIAEASIPEVAKALFETSSWSAQEGSAQRRVQLGVAKKIKNGARKIVLEKAEEARAAAFSAFKSLGLNVPQFSQPIMSLAPADSSKQGASPSSSGDDNTNSVVGLKANDNLSIKQTLELKQDSDKPNVDEGNKLIRTADDGLKASMEGSSHGKTPCNLNYTSHGVPIEGSATMEDTVVTSIEHTSTADVIDLGKSVIPVILNRNLGQQCSIESLPTGSKRAAETGPVSVINTPGGIDSFFDLWEAACDFYFDIHYNKRAEINSVVPFEMHGMAICWEDSPVYYVNIPKDLLGHDKRKNNPQSQGISSTNSCNTPPENWLEIVQQRWKRIEDIMGKRGVRKFSWNMKVQIQVLKKVAVSVQRFGCKNLAGNTRRIELIEGSYVQLAPVYVMDAVDMCIVSWILWPDEERSSYTNLEKEVKKRVSMEAVAAANQSGRWRNQMRRAAHNGCCRRVAQIRVLNTVLWKLLNSEMLLDALLNVEMPLAYILADMELCGIGIDMERCLQARSLLAKKLRLLEKEAYKLAGMTFSLYTAADIANVLYVHLKLPIPEGHGKGKQHPSTDKHCLDLLRHEHPIIPVIKEHRTLAKLLNCTLGSICSLSRLSIATQKYTLHGHWLQTSTATGRLSMEEPNLQCVEHTVDFKMNHDKNASSVNQFSVNARDFFVPTQENWIILTADYSQIELRLMAHFANDSTLIEILSKPNGDVFVMIAARWTGKSEHSVSSNERDQVKRLVYGILYGMGPNTLAEQLGCSSDEASKRIKSFKSSFPGVALWLHEAVASCREKGYIETIKGRRRFLSKIKFGNSKEKSKAQRQAVNSICQGSAADIIKIAMVKINSIIAEGVNGTQCCSSSATKYSMLKGHCHVLLQVHDELVLEVDPSMIKEAALLLQESMESAVSLLVPLHVKLKVGRTWGSLEAFQTVQNEDDILVPHS